MTSYNAANERMKRQYFGYLAEAQGPQRADHRRGGEGDCPVRGLYPVQGLQVVPYRPGQGFRDLAEQRDHRSGSPLSAVRHP